MNFFCSKDCPDLCGIEAIEKNGKYTFKGVPEKWSETGFVCSKFKVFAERELCTKQSSWELTDGKMSELTEQEAIDRLAEMLEQYRDKKILYMRGSGSLAYNMAYWDVFFSKFENCWATSGGPCDDTGGDAHELDFGVNSNPDITNLEKAETIILFGKNAAVCSQHLYSYLKKLKKDGKRIIYIDPVKTRTAEIADRYIQINPMCDGILACALLQGLGLESGYDIRLLLERSGISDEEFSYLKDSIVKGRTGYIQGFGIQRHTNGQNAFQWISRLAVKTGCEDTLYFGHSSKRHWPAMKADFKGHIHVDKIADTLAEGGFDLYVNVAANPAMTFPDTKRWEEGLKNTRTVVVDTNMCRTAEYADFFLKVGGMFTQKDMMASYFFSQDYKRDRIAEGMSDVEAVMLLSKKLGFDISEKKLEDVPVQTLAKRDYRTDKLGLDVPDKKDGLMLITSSHESYLNSQTLEGMEKGLQVIYINPKDADRLGIKNGCDVKISGDKGSFTADAEITTDVTEGTVMCWKNIPMKKGFTNNAIPNVLTDSGNGLVYYSHYVSLENSFD